MVIMAFAKWQRQLTGGQSLEQTLNGNLDTVDNSEDIVQEVKNDLEVDDGQLADGSLEKGLDGSLDSLDFLADRGDSALDLGGGLLGDIALGSLL